MSARGSVVHVVVAGEIGGAERMLVDLAKGPHDRSHSIALFTPNDELRRLFRSADIAVDDRGPVREGPVSYLARTLGPLDVRWLTAVLTRRQATIVHLHTFASQVLGTRAAQRFGARIVRTEHSTRVYDDPSCWPFSRWSLRRSDAVACISRHVREVAGARAGRDLQADATRIVYNGVDTDHFAPRSAERAAGRTQFLALGRLDRRKGLDIAFEALARTPAAELDVVGDGDERSSLEALASRLSIQDRVRFRGHMVDVRDAIAKADVVLSSARQEGLGIALLEAMAMGRPVVAFPTGGVPEIVDDQTGWLTAESSVDALASAMNAAVSAPVERERKGAAARRRVVDRFSVGAMRTSYETIYASLTA